ncbi:hypothetical protein DB88DRAFT_487777 [Papiliotrema laurentii]|uniref:RRM domain-containing protein n=1 Tax=Papiliotrema laurentii TaxID=5418 RepID=A0AAD9FS72_PAPLA|nr:hypothetical protein DB88DRAFT_487777 [Papiliotrema laurentii]
MAEGREPSPRIEDDDVNVDEELQAMQARLAEMEEEKKQLASGEAAGSASGTPKPEGDEAAGDEDDAAAVDARSIYIGNVDYGATPEEIQAHFQACGTINRVTILCDKFTGHPKGYAYVEFADPTIVANALVLHESTFRGRPLQVKEKRTNVPGMNRGRGRGRGRGQRGYHPYRGGRGRGRGGRGW